MPKVLNDFITVDERGGIKTIRIDDIGAIMSQPPGETAILIVQGKLIQLMVTTHAEVLEKIAAAQA